jgi:hypothetical protein
VTSHGGTWVMGCGFVLLASLLGAGCGASAIKCCYAAIGSRLSSTMNKMLK